MEFVTVKYTVNKMIGGENYLPTPINLLLFAFEKLQRASMTNEFLIDVEIYNLKIHLNCKALDIVEMHMSQR